MPYSPIYLSALILASWPDHDSISQLLPDVTCDTDYCIIREEWSPGCMMALHELKGIEDPQVFERAAMVWLSSHEEAIASEIASRHGMRLVNWHHDSDANDTPFGSTIVVLCPFHYQPEPTTP